MSNKHNRNTTEPFDIWQCLRSEAEIALSREPLLGKFLNPVILNHSSFADALTAILVARLTCGVLDRNTLQDIIADVLNSDEDILHSAQRDLIAFCERDPACNRFSIPFLYYKGYQGLQFYRIGHHLWKNRQSELALYLQSRVSEVFDMDIHPAARIGNGILIDHATSIVIGETAVVGDNVSMLHEVTLGGTGKSGGDRHPKVESGVLIGAGAKILGNVKIGENAKVGAGSVVLEDVDAAITVAGVPARPVAEIVDISPALEMDHSLDG